jgi:hypothetical protein
VVPAGGPARLHRLAERFVTPARGVNPVLDANPAIWPARTLAAIRKVC